jgi:hypothetical protein
MSTAGSENQLIKEEPPTHGGMPGWAAQPFRNLSEQVQRQWHLLQLSIRGISQMTLLPRIVEFLAEGNRQEDKATAKQSLEAARRQANLAQREIDEGFPILHAYAALGLWSSLEAAVRLFLARWLQNRKGARAVDAIRKMKVRIGEYESLDGEERFFYILDRLEQEVSAPLRSGINRFEAILEPFGLSGEVDESVQRDLFELSQVRNALMHRAGRVDLALVESCPWLGLEAGTALALNHDAITRYSNAVMEYTVELLSRLGKVFGVDIAQLKSSSSSSRSEQPA